jgi:hypothetical protein
MKKFLFFFSLLIFCMPNILFPQVITNGLVGYWPFDGNANESINGNNGTIVGAVLDTDREGSANKCYTFDGVDDDIWVAHNSIFDLGTHDMSFSMWVKAATTQSTSLPGLIFHGASNTASPGYWLRVVQTTGVVNYSICNGTTRINGSSSSSICDNTWHHVAFTFDRDGLGIIYIDGVNNSPNGGTSLTGFASNDIICTAYEMFGYTNYFTGSLDDIMIFNRVLTPTEVQQLYNNNSLTVTNGTGSGKYVVGSSVTISANTPAAGYIFDHWSGDVTNIADSTAAQTTVTIPAEAIALTAVYKLIWTPAEKSAYFTGNIAIGRENVPTGYDLAVDGKIITKEIQVTLDNWSDFVFSSNYTLMPILQLENYIKEYNHLPAIPSENEVKDQGIGIGEMNAKLLQKVEELTLYIIEQNKRIDSLEKKIEKIEFNTDKN